MTSRFRHYLDTRADYTVDAKGSVVEYVQIGYSYHYSGGGHRLGQTVKLPVESLTPTELARLSDVYMALVARIPAPTPIRLPHATVTPQIRPTGFTFVAQNHASAAILPAARLYYLEEVPELFSRVEKEVRAQKADWTGRESGLVKRVQAWIRARAWAGYRRRLEQYMH